MSDYKKPEEVDEGTWQHHLEWMRVMEASRRPARPMKALMDDYFVPAGSGTNHRQDKGTSD